MPRTDTTDPPFSAAPRITAPLRRLTRRRAMQQYLAAGSLDRSFSVWPQGQPKPLLVVRKAFAAAVNDIAWTPDGFALVAASGDGSVMSVVFDEAELGPRASQGKVRG